MEGSEEVNILQVTLIDPEEQKHNVRLTPGDFLVELKTCLADYAPTSYFTSYHFESSGQILNDYIELSEQGITSGSVLRIVLEPYNEKAVKTHIKRIKETIASPSPPRANIFILEKEEQHAISANSDSSLPILDQQDLVCAPSKLLNPTSQLPIYDTDADEASNELPKCVGSINFYESRSPSPKRRLVGDLAYVVLQTLEGETYYVTSSVSGFYVNGTTNENGKITFRPDISDKRIAAKTLVELLKIVSRRFKEEWSLLLVKANEIENFKEVRSIIPPPEWIVQAKYEAQREPDFDVETIRDWNEEFQMIRDLPAESPLQRIQKDKALSKVYNDFLDVAIKGAKTIIAGGLKPLNPMDPIKQQLFIFNHIFFSFIDDAEYVQHQGPDACYTLISANHDLRAIKFLCNADIPGLHCIASAFVDYRGYRILCQSIIPGILDRTPETSAQYGSIDDGKTIHTDPEFHEIMKQICEKLCLSKSIVLDEEGNKHEIWGAIDSKGIRGSDQRKYFLETLRLTPRDANFLGDEFALALLRPELVEQYQQIKHNEFIEAKVEETIKKKREQAGEDSKLSIEELQEIVKASPKLEFNPNAFTNAKLDGGQEENEQKVVEIGNFLREKQLPLVAKLICNDSDNWTRIGNTFIEVLHRFGVNARYLGKISELITGTEYKHVKVMCERLAVARSAKRVINEHLRNTSDLHLAETIAHLLNCLLNNMTTTQEPKAVKKRRNKKNKKAQPDVKLNLIELQKPASLDATPESIWGLIKARAQNHFGLTLPNRIEFWEAASSPGLRIAFLREVCLQTGIQLSNQTSFDMPLTSESIASLNVRVKAIEWKSMESRWLYENAMKSLNESNIETASEMLIQSAGIQEQVTGPLHIDIGFVYQKLSQIYLSQNDFQQAISYQHKAILILERILGNDHLTVGQSYMNFAYLYQGIGKYKRAMKHMLHALQIFFVNSGEMSAEAITALLSIGIMYRELGLHETSIGILSHVMEMCLAIYGEKNIKVAECSQILATEHKFLKDYESAKIWETRALEIFRSVLPETHPRIKEAEESFETLNKMISGTIQADPSAVNARVPRTNDKKAYLKQKLHARKMKAKLGLPIHQLHQAAPFDEMPMRQTKEQIDQEKIQKILDELQKRENK